MKNLIDSLKGIPEWSGMIKKWAVLEIVEDYLAEHPPGMIEVRGCTKEEVIECLRVFEKERGVTGRGITAEETIPLVQLRITMLSDETYRVEIYAEDVHDHKLSTVPTSIIRTKDAGRVLSEVRDSLDPFSIRCCG